MQLCRAYHRDLTSSTPSYRPHPNPTIYATTHRDLPTSPANLAFSSNPRARNGLQASNPSPEPLTPSSLPRHHQSASGLFRTPVEAKLRSNVSHNEAAEESSVKVYALISPAEVSKGSPIPCSKMKSELEGADTEVGSSRTVLVKLGLLLGNREQYRPADAAEAFLKAIIKGLGGISKW